MSPTSPTSSCPALTPHRLGFVFALIFLAAVGCVHSTPSRSQPTDASRPASSAPGTANPSPAYRARFERYLPAVAVASEPFRGSLT